MRPSGSDRLGSSGWSPRRRAGRSGRRAPTPTGLTPIEQPASGTARGSNSRRPRNRGVDATVPVGFGGVVGTRGRLVPFGAKIALARLLGPAPARNRASSMPSGAMSPPRGSPEGIGPGSARTGGATKYCGDTDVSALNVWRRSAGLPAGGGEAERQQGQCPGRQERHRRDAATHGAAEDPVAGEALAGGLHPAASGGLEEVAVRGETVVVDGDRGLDLLSAARSSTELEAFRLGISLIGLSFRWSRGSSAGRVVRLPTHPVNEAPFHDPSPAMVAAGSAHG